MNGADFLLNHINKKLEAFIPIANVVAKTFGKNCEVVIHDLSMPQNSVVLLPIP